ncbi:MAG: PSD1 domain-containing protein [Flavobacteriaceae bacterium]|nr:PSD1 domain-containing protein [Flavobacteriaceae bacterium]
MKSFYKYSLYFFVPLILIWGGSYFFSGPKEVVQTDIELSIPQVISYNFDVKPILSDKCYACHGPDAEARQAELRLDLEEGAFKTAKYLSDMPIIAKGDPEGSALIHHIRSTDAERQMPPPSSNLLLSERQKELLSKWIEQGALWEEHWAYQTPIKSSPPSTAFDSWAINEIDFFIAKRLEAQNMQPSNPASKEIILRRLAFDLTGLPPSIELMDQFLKDTSDEAYEKMVDHFMSLPQFGEHMASSWLDVARYADTHGYQDDLERVMWPWRDWVIHAFNKNLPYDQFISWQLAGDLYENPSLEMLVATGFNRNHKITQEGGVIDEEYRVEYVADRTITTSKALMGLTVECARCHDHKYDAVSQKEFFSLYSFFDKVDEKGRIEYGETPAPFIVLDKEIVANELSFMHLPDSIEKVELMVMKEEPNIRSTYTLKRGVYDAPDQEVFPATPERVLAFDDGYVPNRKGLANWFFDPNNPLTSRVVVNRYWQQFFGRGIVSTPDDFGNQGARPTHPKLLDWLASTFRTTDQWDSKQFIKRLVMSATYRQSSKRVIDNELKDPENKYLSYYPRQKLTAEMVRDNALATSGLLNKTIGGPSVKPHQPEGLWEETTSGQGLTRYTPDTGSNLYRRSLYTFWKRTVPPPNMMTFDASSRDFCSVERQKTSTPLQSLVLMNDPQFYKAAQHISKRIEKLSLSNQDKIVSLFRQITLRKPLTEEVEMLKQYFDELTLEKDNDQAFTDLAVLIYNLDETTQKS